MINQETKDQLIYWKRLDCVIIVLFSGCNFAFRTGISKGQKMTKNYFWLKGKFLLGNRDVASCHTDQ